MIIIDESQNLTSRQLEQIRLLSNLETDKEKLLQIVLVGQPELRKKLELYELRQLRQRIMVDYHIDPLDEDELDDYIDYRINMALLDNRDKPRPSFNEELHFKEERGKPIKFNADAVREIYRFSGGVPRLVNLLCDRALLLGFIKERRAIAQDIIGECVKDIKVKPSTS